MKRVKISLLFRVIIAIVAGICFGNLLTGQIVRIFITFNELFSQFLGFIIPLIIIGLVTPAIASIGSSAGKLLLATTVVAYLDTVCSGLFSYLTSSSVFPSLIPSGINLSQIAQAQDAEPYFSVKIPPMMDVMTALVFSFMAGLGIAHTTSRTLRNVFDEFKEIISKTIEVVIIPLLPIYIFGIFLNLTHSGQVMKVLSVFVSIIVIIFAMHILLLLFQYGVAGLFVKRNPLKLLGRMMPAYFTALGTSSSAATIPVTRKQVIKNGVSEEIADFTVPLCATIHLSGSELKIVACAVALMLMQGQPVDFGLFAGFICMLGIIMVAAPGVPGGAIMSALGILASMLGFDSSEQALIIALYITMDSFGTACNVTGDGAIALIMDKYFGKSRSGHTL